MRGICLTLALVLTSTLVMARSYFLPDYQGSGLERRIQDTDKQNNITTCSPYGLYNSIQSGMTCSVVYPASGLTCYTCACESVYKYSSADCPTPPYILSDQCKGKYKSCSCDTTLYPTTSATGGCQYGFIPDINNYCEDKPDATKHYACVKPVCKPDNITVEDCQAQGDGHNCTASKEANCTDYCDTNGCQDNCAYLTQTGQARSDCQYGCATGKDVSGCSGLCYECAAAPDAAPNAPTNTCADIYDGKSHTKAAVNQLGKDALAAWAADNFHVGDMNGAFGRGHWYLPAIGEWMDFYGTDASKMTGGALNSGAVGDNKAKINAALTTLGGKGADAKALTNGWYWSSSEDDVVTITWYFDLSSGDRRPYINTFSCYVRPFQLLENCFDPTSGSTPKIGDVMYFDKTWGSANDYDGSKQAVGIVSAVGNDGSVKIVSLKNLTFSTWGSVGNFNPYNPYGGTIEKTYLVTEDKQYEDVVDIPNYDDDALLVAFIKCATEGLCSGPTIFECEDGYRCIASTEEGCNNYCASECMDICRYEQVVNNAVSDCQYGCAAGKEVNRCPDLCYKCGKKINTCVDFYDGKSNTKAAVNQQGKEALAAWAADNFYVGDKNGAFGQGQWYLPTIGEWIDFYGTDVSKITDDNYISGAVGDNKAKIDAALTTLRGKGADAQALTNNVEYWSSSERAGHASWYLILSSGNRQASHKSWSYYVRPCLLLENCFNPATNSTPKIGDVMYADKTWGSAEDYDGSKQAIGIVSAVGNDGSVKIISLKDLTFSSQNRVGNFNPDNPYGGSRKNTQWATNAKYDEDVLDITNYSDDKFLAVFKSCAANERLCSGRITIAGCEANGDGYRCIASTEEGCSNHCASECMDRCRYEQVVNNAVSNCQYGCAVGKEVSGCPDLCHECAGAPDANTCVYLYDGKSNTKAAVNQLGNEALAAYAATQFYVGDKNGDFGQGKWYLPAIGEWMDFYGTDVSKMTEGDDDSDSWAVSGAVGDNKAKIDAALTTLGGKGADAKAFSDYYWSSSEYNYGDSWLLIPSEGYRTLVEKAYPIFVRPCQLLENCFDPTSGSTPKIGDVMYADKTWGSAEDYDGSKQAVGIVSAVGNDGSVKIISLKDLTFSSEGSTGNFNPDDPYGGTKQVTQWATNAKLTEDVVDIPNYNENALPAAAKICRE